MCSYQTSYKLSWQKRKYHDKALSNSAVTVTWQRILDGSKDFADYVWLNIPLFDLSQLGLGLLFSMLPFEFKPFTIDFTFELPTDEEIAQGIWADFEKVNYEFKYPWTTSPEEFAKTNFKPEYYKDILKTLTRKAYYGVSTYEGFVYDPVLAREYTSQTFHKMRLIRTPDQSFIKTSNIIAEKMDVSEVVPYEVTARLRLLASAQENSFVLGLSTLGRSRLSFSRFVKIDPRLASSLLLLRIIFR
jgi:hypothetical protein